MINNELIEFLNTIEQLKPDLKENLCKLKDTLAHSAPEIWNETY